MTEDFERQIKGIYENIILGIKDITSEIIKVKSLFHIGEELSIGEYYTEYMGKDKGSGNVYTPLDIVEYIIKNTISKEDIINNPFLTILDPACGCGNFMISCYKYLYQIFSENLEEINRKNNLKINKEDISKHIISNNMFCFDINNLAKMVFVIDLYLLAGTINSDNIKLADYLIEEQEKKFDVILGNPPYVGHKAIGRDYYKVLKNKFSIYKDKSDLSYCFFYKGSMDLKPSGKLSFITSRYFIESPSGEGLRKLLVSNFKIKKIVDFYGVRPFKETGIDPVIIFLEKGEASYNEINVIKPENISASKNFYKSLVREEPALPSFVIKQNSLNDSGWILKNKEAMGILKKIEGKAKIYLSDICDSYQGIITGCDRAFVVDNETIKREELETDILRPWIKSSSIGNLRKKKSFLIYSDLIEDINKYPNAIKHISLYKDRLINRRECRTGARKWYNLQWGRKTSTFEKGKLIFPYKNSKNNFCYDRGSFYSADIYSLIIKDEKPFSYEYLAYLLNSDIYDFYFKAFGKKLGDKQYEYYPSYVMRIKVPKMPKYFIYSKDYLYDYFELDKEEVKLIQSAHV